MPATRVYVVPGALGDWAVRDEQDRLLSTHGTETEAEQAAHDYARRCGAPEIELHDRYGRVHRVLNGRRETAHRPY